jgi:hypothetical protein
LTDVLIYDRSQTRYPMTVFAKTEMFVQKDKRQFAADYPQ